MDRATIAEFFTQLKLRTIGEALAVIEPYRPMCYTKEVVAIRDGYKIEVLPKGRPSNPARLHVFDDIQAMAEFIRRHWTQAKQVEIFLRTDGTFEAVSNNTWDCDRITCSLAPHLTAKRWQSLWNVGLEQRRAFQEFYALRKTFEAGPLLAGIKSLEVKGATGYSGHLDDRGVYLLKAVVNEKSVACELPSSIVVRTPIFRGQEQEWDVEVDISIDVEGSKPIFSLKPTNLDEVRQLATEERALALLALLNEDRPDEDRYQVYRGTLKLAE